MVHLLQTFVHVVRVLQQAAKASTPAHQSGHFATNANFTIAQTNLRLRQQMELQLPPLGYYPNHWQPVFNVTQTTMSDHKNLLQSPVPVHIGSNYLSVVFPRDMRVECDLDALRHPECYLSRAGLPEPVVFNALTEHSNLLRAQILPNINRLSLSA